MKRIGLLVIVAFVIMVMSACGSKDEKVVSLDQMIKAYQDAGIEVDPAEKPMFEMAQAKDGVIFYIDNQKVAIYEYASKKDADKVKKEDEIMKDWPQNGNLILESKNDKALQIFNSVK